MRVKFPPITEMFNQFFSFVRGLVAFELEASKKKKRKEAPVNHHK
jgi:hypothetical protein